MKYNASDEQAIKDGFFYSEKHAQRALKFISKYLIPPHGFRPNEPIQLLPWQQTVISTIYGWVDKHDRMRFDTAYITMAKRNGKSLINAGMALYTLCKSKHAAPNCVSIATTQEQAEVIYNYLYWCWHQNAKRDNILRECLSAKPSSLLLDYSANNAYFQSISFTPARIIGDTFQYLALDEYSFWPRKEKMTSAIRYAQDDRTDPIKVISTTSGFDKISESYQMYRKAVGIQNSSIVDPKFASFVWSAQGEPDQIDIMDPSVWESANPSIGHSVSYKKIKEKALEASLSIAAKLDFLTLRCNCWCNPAECLFNLDAVARAEIPAFPARLKEEGEWIMALDLAAVKDLCGFSLCCKHDGKVYIVGRALTCRGAALKREQAGLSMLYERLALEGCLEIVEGDMIAPSDMCNMVEKLLSEYNVKQIIMDTREGGAITEQFQNRVQINRFLTYPRYFNAPTKYLMSLVERGQLRFSASNNDKLLWLWQFSNVGYKHVEGRYILPIKLQDNWDNVCALIFGLSVYVTPSEKVEELVPPSITWL